MIHTIWGKATKRANLVPVDYCVNAMIVAAYDIMVRHDNRNRVLLSEQEDMDNKRRSMSSSKESNQLVDGSVNNNSESFELPTYNFMYREHGLTWGKYMEMASLGFESRLHQAVW